MAGASPVRVLVFKGFPGVGKTTLSRAIAERLRAPRFDKDDLKDVLYGANVLPEERCNDLSKQLLWRLVAEQVQLGVPYILVDAPFRFRADLVALMTAIRERLRPSLVEGKVANASRVRRVELRIVNCQLTDEVEWRRRIEYRGRQLGPSETHRPCSWEAVQKLRNESDSFKMLEDGLWTGGSGINRENQHSDENRDNEGPDGPIHLLWLEMDMSSPALDMLLAWCRPEATAATRESPDP